VLERLLAGNDHTCLELQQMCCSGYSVLTSPLPGQSVSRSRADGRYPRFLHTPSNKSSDWVSIGCVTGVSDRDVGDWLGPGCCYCRCGGWAVLAGRGAGVAGEEYPGPAGVRESRMQYDNDENMKQSAGSAMYSQADSPRVMTGLASDRPY
jgi:hypothetical protein